MRSVKEEFGSLKNLILKVVEEYPECADSDKLLYIQCNREIGANTLEDLEKSPINPTSVHKSRQMLSNKLKLINVSDEVKEMRNQRQKDIRDYMKEAN